ncbi:DUF6683 family protein [Roseobacter sp. MH60115]|uniref:DUF6683 family protein n=1 Tax=Roseobacter sp. MH60115 TaxID=2785324 RepID=UPI0018A24C3D|nr:DUF6683 family protein [Roseobacter sp. MH60115]
MTTFTFVAGVSPRTGSAQDFSMPMIQIAPDFAMSNLNRELLDRRNAAQNDDNTNTSNAPAPLQLDRSVLRFTPDQGRRAENMQGFLSQIRESDPEGAAKLEAIFASADVMTMIADAMTSMGMDANNVADAYAVWWISSYQASQGSAKTPPRRQYQAVRQQSEGALLSSKAMASASEAEKQQFAEAYLLQAALIDSGVQEMQPNPAQLDALKTAVKKGALASGLDLDRMILTDKGFLAN